MHTKEWNPMGKTKALEVSVGDMIFRQDGFDGNYWQEVTKKTHVTEMGQGRFQEEPMKSYVILETWEFTTTHDENDIVSVRTLR